MDKNSYNNYVREVSPLVLRFVRVSFIFMILDSKTVRLYTPLSRHHASIVGTSLLNKNSSLT